MPPPACGFKRVPETSLVKNRVHIDLEADHVDAELLNGFSRGATLAPEQANYGALLRCCSIPRGTSSASSATSGATVPPPRRRAERSEVVAGEHSHDRGSTAGR